MPTAYTAMIDDGDVSTAKDWMLQGLSRAFGVAFPVRDDEWNLSPEEMKRRIAKHHHRDMKWSIDELDKVQRRLKNYQTATIADIRAQFELENEEIRIRYERMNAEQARNKQRHDVVRHGLEIILNTPNMSEVTMNMAKFGIEQLDLVERTSCEPFTPTFYKSPTDFLNKKMEKVVWDFEYHMKELKRKYPRGPEALAIIDRVKQDISNAVPDEIYN